MTIDEMTGRVKGWITDRSKTVEECLEVAEDIRDLCDEWINAFRDDLEPTCGPM